MKSRSVVKWLGIILIVVGIVALAAGSIVYAKVQTDRSATAANIIDDDSERGIVIASVAPDGPAAAAGVKRGDILLAINEVPVDRVLDLQDQLAGFEAGEEIELTVLHGDENRVLVVTLDERDGKPFLGVTPCGGCRLRAGRLTSTA